MLPKHHLLISIGSNINKYNNTVAGLNALHLEFSTLRCSTMYESEAVGFTGDTFYNAVVEAFTNKSIEQVCAILKSIEDKLGRVRGVEKFASRTLDLDLLTFDNHICQYPIVLPREEILYNAFVLRPLHDLVPDKHHPIINKSYAQLWNEYDKEKQTLWPIEFNWSNPS